MIVCIAGKNKIAINALQHLLAWGHPVEHIVACTNKTDEGVDGWQPSYKLFCRLNGVRVVELKELYEIEDLLFISLEYDRLIKPQLFKSRQLFNIHFSKLPAYKGMYTSVMPVLNGETVSGVTLHKIDPGIDTGDVIEQTVFDLPVDANAQMLYYLYLEHGTTLFKKTLPRLLSGSFQAQPQSTTGASYYAKDCLDFKNLTLNLNKTAFEIKNQVRAYAFRAYQLPCFNNCRLSHAQIENEKATQKPGTVLSEDDYSFLISSIDYNIRLYKDRLASILEAAANGAVNELEIFKQHHYSFIEKNERGWDALIVAAYHEQTYACQWLIENGCNPNAANNNGTSVLMYAMTAASKSNRLDLMKYLISCGARVNYSDHKGKSLLQYAAEYNNPHVISFLKSNT